VISGADLPGPDVFGDDAAGWGVPLLAGASAIWAGQPVAVVAASTMLATMMEWW